MSTLVIVESPAKSHTIAKFLGKGYVILPSIGHIRDLPEGRLGILVEDGGTKFTANRYEIDADKKEVVAKIVAAARKADEILLASDPDREGEAIAWHLDEVLREKLGAKDYASKRVLRVTYNEITRGAVTGAIAHSRETNRGIDLDLVNAQQTRRFLDRFVGWRVSRAVAGAVREKGDKAAGRVQSVALRMVCEREDAIAAFRPEAYWEYLVDLRKRIGDPAPFAVRLRQLDGAKADVRDEATNAAVVALLEHADYRVEALETTRKERAPGAPFTTDTLQMAASTAFHFSPKYTMQPLAQSLYEAGLITYMRTDHAQVSAEAMGMAAKYVRERFGEDHSQPRSWARRAAGEQGAHEGIRPTDVARPRAEIEATLREISRLNDKARADALRLYELIWKRFVTSQMKPAVYEVGTARIAATAAAADANPRSAVLTASTSRLVFDGFLAAAPERAKEPLAPAKKEADAEKGGREEGGDVLASLPPLAEGEPLDRVAVRPEAKQTKPPAHYNEASLVKAMKDEGIGRPSTYASTLATLEDHKYLVEERNHVLSPTDLGRAVVKFLVWGDARAPQGDALFYVGYTRDMEKQLDAIAKDEPPETAEGAAAEPAPAVPAADWQAVLAGFYTRLQAWLDAIRVKGPAELFRAVFAKFREVREWTPPRQDGNRTYDDRKVVQEMACSFMGEDRPRGKAAAAPYRFNPAAGPAPDFRGTDKQLRYLLSILVSYRDQLADFDAFGRALLDQVSDDMPDAGTIREVVRKAFGAAAPEDGTPAAADGDAPVADTAVLPVIEVLEKGGVPEARREFFTSMRDQVRRGRALSPKQTPWLFRIFHEAGQAGMVAGYGPDLCKALGVPWTEVEQVDAERVNAVLGALAQVGEWEPAATRRGRTYDDKAFFEDVAKGWRERGRMFPKALAALERMLARYSGQVPGAAAILEKYGIAAPKARRAAGKSAGRGNGREGAQERPATAKAAMDPAAKAKVEAIFAAFEGFDGWPAPRGRGKGDKTFFESFQKQFRQKGSLSDKQVAVLERILRSHRDAIPGAAALMERHGIAND